MQDQMELQAAQAEIIEEFSFFDDWTDKYKYIIDLGRNLPQFPEKWKTDENLVSGCQAQVWFVAQKQEGKLVFFAASDALIVSGLIALLLRVYSGKSPAAILATEPEFIHKIDLSSNLSPSRSNGLHSMIRAIKNLAARSVE